MGTSKMSPLKIGLLVIVTGIAALIGFNIGKNASGPMILLLLVGFVAMIAFFLSGNRKEVALDSATVADALRLQAPTGKARLYVVRHGFVGGMQGMEITIDSSHSGQIKSGRALFADLAPGHHLVGAKMAKGGKSSATSLELDLAADTVTVLKAGTEMGALTTKCVLEVLPSLPVAQQELKKARFLAWYQA